MSMVLLTILGLIIAGMLTGIFPAIGAAIHRRQRGHAIVTRRAARWSPGPRVQAAGPGPKGPGIKASEHAPSGVPNLGLPDDRPPDLRVQRPRRPDDPPGSAHEGLAVPVAGPGALRRRRAT